MKNVLTVLLPGLLLGVAGFCLFFSTYGQKLEENLGLALLFTIRGSRPAPEKVVIVNLDRFTSQQMGLPENLSKWPRTVYARLVDVLKKRQAAVIAFDVHFAEPRDPVGDRVFADSIRRAGNVVLFEKIERKTLGFPGRGTQPGRLEMDILVPPFPLLADSALALAPFPLPKLPVRINQAWIFKTSAGEQPTLPAAVLQVFGMRHYEKLRQLIGKEIRSNVPLLLPASGAITAEGDFAEFGQTMRRFFLENPGLVRRLLHRLVTDSPIHSPSEENRLLRAFVRTFAGANSLYLNYYGPPATFATYSCAEILSGGSGQDLPRPEIKLKDKIVFVGTARKSWAGQKDGFYTVFSRPDGLDLSGVELAATVFANLYENTAVKPLSSRVSLALLVVFGLIVTLCCRFASPLVALLLLFVVSLSFLGGAYFSFSAYGIWIPLVVPLGFQSVIAFLATLYWKYFRAGRERENIRKALRFYLPEKAVEALSKDLSFISKGDQMVYSVCLMTDAQNYTTLSEKMDPRRLSIHMKEYYSYLFGPVNRTGGVVSDVVGDSMLALWPSIKPLSALRENSCQAALQIIAAVDEFNRRHPHSRLPTRIGLHFGYMLIGNIGADNHFEYAPIGDIVNTASRIEGLNKYLGTNVLATEEVVNGLQEIVTRSVGNFLLPGKSNPVGIYELLTFEDGAPGRKMNVLCELFSNGLICFTDRRWNDALIFFQQCQNVKSDDGPSLFYLNLCRKYQRNPPPLSWKGVVAIEEK